MPIFERALETMRSRGTQTFGPVSFQDYVTDTGETGHRDTWQAISVDSVRRLRPELVEAGVMVFRLGSPPGSRTTNFALAACVSGWSDYFLLDNEVFGGAQAELFVPDAPVRHLLPFLLLPAFTETSFVNLAFACGLLAHALGLEPHSSPAAPAVGQSTFSFDVIPHPELGVAWRHENGQVEFDGVFTGRRGNIEAVFVVEAKVGSGSDSLAKHKLVYPALALRGQLPPDIQLIPVYMRAHRDNDGVHFLLAECAPLPVRGPVPSISCLAVRTNHHLVLPGLFRA